MIAKNSLGKVAACKLGEAALAIRNGAEDWSLGVLAEDSLGRMAAGNLGVAAEDSLGRVAVGSLDVVAEDSLGRVTAGSLGGVAWFGSS